jgi:hypothetical protein
MYFDRNANGDLTDAEDLVRGEFYDTAIGKPKVYFDIQAFKDPKTGHTHTEANFEIDVTNNVMTFWCKWRDLYQVQSGFGRNFIKETQLSDQPSSAPIFWPGAEQPIGFNPWCLDKLVIGRKSRIAVLLGHHGHGANSFSALSQYFLPIGVPVIATLNYRDSQNFEKNLTWRLNQRCCGFQYYDTVDVPRDAHPGMATLRFELPLLSGIVYESFETTVELAYPEADDKS